MHPLRPIGRESADRNHAMHMGMMQQILTPGVEHSQEADRRAEMVVSAATSRSVAALARKSRSYTIVLFWSASHESSCGSVKTTGGTPPAGVPAAGRRATDRVRG